MGKQNWIEKSDHELIVSNARKRAAYYGAIVTGLLTVIVTGIFIMFGWL